MKKTIISVLATAVVAGQAFSGPIVVSASGPVPPSCSLSAKPGRILVNFPGAWIGSNIGPTEVGPILTAVPAGNYKVTLMSWDGYLGRESVNQDYEQWKLEIENGSGLLASSGVISDLADYIQETSLTEVVNDGSNLLSVLSAGTKVFARHAFVGYPNANSVTPICAALDPTPNCCLGDVKVSVKNKDTTVVNVITTSANTGWNAADGGSATMKVKKSGNVKGTNNDHNTTSAGGNSSTGGSGGAVVTGNATAKTKATTTVNSTIVRVRKL